MKHKMKVGGTGKMPPKGKNPAIKASTKSKPKELVGKQKQTEGYTPSMSLPTASRAGGKKARDQRLSKVAM